jgi:Transglutaminase-like superfamily
MKTGIMQIAGCFVLLGTTLSALKAAPIPTRTLEESLALAGKNRPELQKFLDGHKGPDAELLIRMARQTDLANLTDQLLTDNLDSVQKAKTNAPWASRVPPEIWQEFVLPYRVADEPLDDFKPEFYGKVFPSVASAQESGEAALLVHHWYWTSNGGGPQVAFAVTESRDQPPRILLNQTKIGRCFEMNLLCVALLRSVGVPARIAGASYWMNTDFYHFWVEYYDTKTGDWHYFEGAGSDPGIMAAQSFLPKSPGTAQYPTIYAFPGFCSISDPVGKERWDILINTTPLYISTGTLHFSASRGPREAPPVFTVYSWNSAAWRSVAQITGDDQGTADIKMSPNNQNYQYLVSMAVGGKLFWETTTVVPNNETDIDDLTINQTPQESIVSFIPSANHHQDAHFRGDE